MGLVLAIGAVLLAPASVAAPRADFHHASLIPATDCIDPQYHFTVRKFHGIVRDFEGNAMPNITADRHRFQKDDEGDLEPLPKVFATFVTDAEGHFSLPKLRHGIYLVIVHQTRLYWTERVNIKIDRHGSPNALVATMGIRGDCLQSSWKLSDQ